ncbi:MAG: response regulator transcription factor [Gammaproteobacteria bacterium]
MAAETIIHVVDDDRRFLAALERSLRSTGLAVKAYASARDFLSRFEPDQPGCLITDLRMPDIDGISLQKTLRERKIRIPIIFITGHGEASTAVAALKGGAVDFLEKPFSEQVLLDSVRSALEKDATDRALAGEKTVVKQRFVNLTPREQEVFALVVSDLPNKEIAHRLKISPRTVEHHREHVMLKMQAESIAELITMAVLCGIHELHL